MSPCPHCPHCKSAQNAQLGWPDSQDEIMFVQAEADRLFDLIIKLNNDRAVLLRRLNSLRSATRNVPSEILSLIFQCVAPPCDISSRGLRLYREETYRDPPDTYNPVLLGTICSQWYYVAQSTPQLWTSLVLDVQDMKSAVAKLALLKLYLKNVKNLSFSLELKFNREKLHLDAVLYHGNDPVLNYRKSFQLLTQFGDIIFSPENACRIKVLWMSEAPPTWSPLCFDGFQRLEELRLGTVCNKEPTPMHILECKTPHLRRIIAKNTHLIMPTDVDVGTWSQRLTVINLFRVPISNCLELLTLCPGLVEFRARESLFIWEGEFGNWPPDLDDTFTMPKLQILEWTCAHNSWNTAFLEHVRLPSLHTLGWGGDHTLVDSDGLVEFFEALPPTLVKLELIGLVMEPDELNIEWEDFLARLIHVRELSLLQCSFRCVASILGSLRNLDYLPALEEMSIIGRPEPAPKQGHDTDDDDDDDDDDDTDDDDKYKPDVRDQLREMSVCRWLSPEGKKFRFGTMDCSLDWEYMDGEWVCEVVKGGLELEIFEDSEFLEYLYEESDDE